MKKVKKLIEVALPLAEINDASAYDKLPGIGPHPKGIHQWWARLPLPVARAVIFSSVVNDPSEDIEKLVEDKNAVKLAEIKLVEMIKIWNKRKKEFKNKSNYNSEYDGLETKPTLESILIEKKREELFEIIRDLMKKKPHENKKSFEKARKIIEESCDGRKPEVLDPFTGGGSIPLEAQRLGFKSHGRDLNPVPALITKATIDYPSRFFNQPPVSQSQIMRLDWKGGQGIAEDVRYYGKWMLDEAHQKCGDLYPKVNVTDEMISDRPELHSLKGLNLPIIAWIWARTVPSPNPALVNKEVPLISTFWLSKKKGNEAWLEPIIEKKDYKFKIRTGNPNNRKSINSGTKRHRANFECILSGIPITSNWIKDYSAQSKFGYRLLAIVADSGRNRVYLNANEEQENIAKLNPPIDRNLEILLPTNSQYSSPPLYGMKKYCDIFTNRQLNTLSILSSLINKVKIKATQDGASEIWAEAIATYLAFAVDRLSDFNNNLCRWSSSNEKVMNLFGLQAIPMAWDFAEANILNKVVGGFESSYEYIAKCIEITPILENQIGEVKLQDARKTQWNSESLIISTDPPYYDNVPYADISDFFYVWLRKSLKEVHPQFLSTIQTPKDDELVAAPHRHLGNKEEAKDYFENGFKNAFSTMRASVDKRFPLTVYYAMKQSEGSDGLNTGWETMLSGLIGSGFTITATWPIRAAQDWRVRSLGSNALASYIILSCRERSNEAKIISRREFIKLLRTELPGSILHLQKSNISPVDLPQSSIGPGMAIYSRYKMILEDDGTVMSVRTALKLINNALDEFLSDQELNLDSLTRFAITWFSQFRFDEGLFGIADELSRARNVDLKKLQHIGLLKMGGGKVQMLRTSEMPETPNKGEDLTLWEVTHRLIHELKNYGEKGTSDLLKAFGTLGYSAQELSYRLYDICEKNKWSEEALGYNSLVTSWPEIRKLAMQEPTGTTVQGNLFE